MGGEHVRTPGIELISVIFEDDVLIELWEEIEVERLARYFSDLRC
jgi:hypothetical protein